MISTKEYLNATPRLKAAYIVDGLLQINTQLSKTARELKILNGWIGLVPQQIAKGEADAIDLQELNARYETFLNNTDALTEQFIINKEKIDQLVKFLDV